MAGGQAYARSKVLLNSYTRTLSARFPKVNAFAVSPGPTFTEMLVKTWVTDFSDVLLYPRFITKTTYFEFWGKTWLSILARKTESAARQYSWAAYEGNGLKSGCFFYEVCQDQPDWQHLDEKISEQLNALL